MPATKHKVPTGVEDDFEKYRDVVATIFSRHHREEISGETRCSCGGAWPCRDEMLAAELLDWI